MSPRCRMRRHCVPFVEQDLEVERSLEFEAHLDTCDTCREEVERQRALDEGLLSLPAPVLFDSDRQRWKEGIRTRVAVPPTPRRWRPTPMQVAAAASLLLAVGGIRWWGQWFSRAPSSPPSASMAANERPVPDGTRPDPHRAPGNTLSLGPDDGTNHELSEPRTPEPRQLLTSASPSEDAASSSTQDSEKRGLATGTVEFVFDPQSPVRQRNELRASLQQARNHESPHAQFLIAMAHRGHSKRQARAVLERHVADLWGASDPSLAVLATQLVLEFADLDPADRGISFELVDALESSFSRMDRAEHAVQFLGRISGASATRAMQKAMERPDLRVPALLALMGSKDRVRTKTRHLLELLRSERDHDRAVLSACLSRLPRSDQASLSMLVALFEEGASRQRLAPVLDELEGEALEAWSRGFRDRGTLTMNQAVQLAKLSPRVELLEELEEAVRRQGNPIAVQALAEGPSAAHLSTLLTLLGDDRLSISRQGLVRDGLLQRLQTQTDSPWPEALAAVSAEARSLFLELCARDAGAAGSATLRQVLQSSALDPTTRGLASLWLSRHQDSPLQAETLLTMLREQDPESPGDPSRLLTSSLLVVLYHLEGEDGLRAGCEALGLQPSAGERHRFARRVQRLPGGTPARSVDQLPPLLELLGSP